jgi:hypothetical protein
MENIGVEFPLRVNSAHSPTDIALAVPKVSAYLLLAGSVGASEGGPFVTGPWDYFVHASAAVALGAQSLKILYKSSRHVDSGNGVPKWFMFSVQKGLGAGEQLLKLGVRNTKLKPSRFLPIGNLCFFDKKNRASVEFALRCGELWAQSEQSF